MASNPHDALFKACFGQPDLARGELELVLPRNVIAHLDLATLAVCGGSFVDEELQQTHSDVLYRVRTSGGGEGYIYVLLEHQSSPDGTMPFRMLRYIVRAWERWLREHPGARTLPIVVPVLLHHGDAAWKAAPELASMIDAAPALLEAVRPFVPHFRFVLDDLAALSPAAVVARARRAAAARAARAVGVALLPAPARGGAVHAGRGGDARARRPDARAADPALRVRAQHGAGRR